MNFNEIETKEDYVEFLEREATSIVAAVMDKEIDHESEQERHDYIESNEGFQHATDRVAELRSNCSITDVASVFEILQYNYNQTVNYVRNEYSLNDNQLPEDNFRVFVEYCVAYDLSKMVDEKINQTLDDEQSTEVVEV